MIRHWLLALTSLLTLLPLARPVTAMVGGAKALSAANPVVTVVGSRGTFCSGTLVAADLVLSAAHCTLPGATYKIVIYGADKKPQLLDVRRIASHPDFNAQSILAHRASADVTLLQLVMPIDGQVPAPVGTPRAPVVAGNMFTVAGVGVTVRGDGRSGGVVRTASLVATGQPGNLQIRLVDAATDNRTAGLGACTGDSGAPVFEDHNGRAVVVGVVSWSTGPNNTAGCGGLTGVTPLTLYRAWIRQTAQAWGSSSTPAAP